MSSSDMPLRVVEVAPGEGASYAARYLQALGATVTKVVCGPRPAGSLPELDVGKDVRSLGDAEREASIRDLAASADVVLWAGQMAEMPDSRPTLAELRADNPSLITGAITPFGESGPHAGRYGTDLTAVHTGGLGYGTPPRVTDPESEHPLGIPGSVTEPLTGLVLVLGVLEALLQRDGDGKGRHVEVSAQEAVASLMFNNVATLVESGRSPGRRAADRQGARRQFLPCADGLLVMMAGRPHHLRAWLNLLGREALDLSRRSEQGETQARVAQAVEAVTDAWTADKSRRQITDLAQASHIPVEPVLAPGEVLACPQLEARGFWEKGPGEIKLAGHPFGASPEGSAPRAFPSLVSLPAADRTWRRAESRGGPLSGIRVLDFTWVFAGPIATRVLAALGASVVKVEASEGNDDSRRPFLARTLHGGKLSIVRDLNDRESLASVQRLAAECDVVIENFSPGVMEKHGLGWAELAARNPRLVLVSISGMGQTGPYAHHVMFGQVAQAYSGLTSIIGYEGGPPRGIEDGGFWSDPVTGYAAAAATLAALRERESTAVGRRIDISLVEATVATLFRPLLAAAKGDVWKPRGNSHPEMAPHDVYRCAPGDADAWFALAVRSDEEWRRLAEMIRGQALARDPGFATLGARQARRQELREIIESWSRNLSPAEATAACQALGIAAAPCHDTRGLVEDEHLRARGLIAEDEAGPAYVRLPWLLHPGAPRAAGAAPRAGEHAALLLGGPD